MERCKTVLVVGTSIYGKISPARGISSKEFGSYIPKKASLELHKLRANVNGILVSSSTVLSDNPSLTVRSASVKKNPYRIVIYQNGRIPLNSKVLNNEAETIILTSKEGKLKLEGKISEEIQFILCKRDKNGLDLNDALEKLRKIGIKNILIEGGGTINHSLFSLGLIDKMVVFIFPFIVGGKDTPTVVDGQRSFYNSLIKMKLKHSKQIMGCLMNIYENEK